MGRCDGAGGGGDVNKMRLMVQLPKRRGMGIYDHDRGVWVTLCYTPRCGRHFDDWEKTYSKYCPEHRDAAA